MTVFTFLRRKRTPSATAPDEVPVAAFGRNQAAEDLLHSSRLAPNTAILIGSSLFASVLLYGYYAHAYTHRTSPKASESATNGTPVAEMALPPLPTIESRPAARPDAPTDPHAYIIGNILDPNNDLALESAATPAEDAGRIGELNVAVSAMPATPVSPQAQARRLEGAVFTRMVQPSPSLTSGPAEEGIADTSNEEPDTVNPTVDSHRGALESLLRAETTPTVAAAILPTQRLLLPKGAFLDCTLETAIDSTLPGLATCLTALDTFSADGTVVLMERGTKLIGEMQSQVQQGAARVFVLWTEARTPKGVVVPLVSPGIDTLGRSGIPGSVDHHFAERFGAAILVSMIAGAVQGLANHSQQSGGTVILNPSGAGDVTTEVLRSTINIPPTVRVPPGARIQVLVARDLDFRSVYALHVR